MQQNFFSRHLLSTKRKLRVVHNQIVLGQFITAVIKNGDKNKRFNRRMHRGKWGPHSLPYPHSLNSLLAYTYKRESFSGEKLKEVSGSWNKEEEGKWVTVCMLNVEVPGTFLGFHSVWISSAVPRRLQTSLWPQG